ncbi:MAG TPA: type I-E CRISPR-associated protein Cas5/CasD [Candidatus Thermoplasmatota archaeon]|nr:type I-E CRISPR-associated protein Cas5/CasD [Candidatus Thermoplasmatota archaeon]
MRHLLFRVYGPISSWGDIAPGTHRPSLALPTRSAILGILGGALGLERTDESGHDGLSRSIGIGIRTEAEGALLMDYHTIQSPSRERRAVWPTRREELQGRKLNTILTSRDYVQDIAFTIAVWEKDGRTDRLDDLAKALDRPRYPPYLGRRSCPPALPFAPHIVDAPTLRDAFRAARFPEIDGEVIRKLRNSEAGQEHLRVEFDVHANPGFEDVRTHRQRDQPLSRVRRTFIERVVHSTVASKEES